MMEQEQTKTTEERIEELLGGFNEKYLKVLKELDSLASGTFDEDDAPSMSAMCLITQAALLSDLAAADLRSRALKRDIDFAKANAYANLKDNPLDGKKVTESALAQLIIKDSEVRRISNEQNLAERDYKQLSNIHALLKEAHLTFRSIRKGV
jgi:hypothetical protein